MPKATQTASRGEGPVATHYLHCRASGRVPRAKGRAKVRQGGHARGAHNACGIYL